ncbi:MAG TPA: hypothetical protein VNQ80_06055 [Parapedobacter sp.]|nr:hypothetical protein [Parapedobacter sp.]
MRRSHPKVPHERRRPSLRRQQPAAKHAPPSYQRSHRTSSEPTNEGTGRCAGVASVCDGACGNGLQRRRQALILVKLLIKQKFVASAAKER